MTNHSGSGHNAREGVPLQVGDELVQSSEGGQVGPIHTVIPRRQHLPFTRWSRDPTQCCCEIEIVVARLVIHCSQCEDITYGGVRKVLGCVKATSLLTCRSAEYFGAQSHYLIEWRPRALL